ncbi:MoaD/ThiS family protein [Stutzerimonas xanthomarina]|uniref:Molybdopterin synthase subunit MoaD n=2 Tax=Stutzerimonas xanthomarina TaxID=271420 RepID=A0A1M5QWM5_9GAMM|nr:MoaD/ThiS family protein [Stutzerimonas xanthomarina]MCP9338353.1 MoaD/ThiS family protein [Stutzerimonas xanthomarina]SEH70540.1 molybdopterin synthase sulfur carrier subunit [Stutzerimonas xanthomarina]SHH18328.1 molybdopterin synthase subunit MoaD [Stutzerimonas xanthomarina DSM 18231]
MIQVQFFARYRETLGRDSERLDWDASWQCVDDLRLRLLARGAEWAVLGEQNLMCARNQELCSLEEPLADGDEVAFFPTVTGG